MKYSLANPMIGILNSPYEKIGGDKMRKNVALAILAICLVATPLVAFAVDYVLQTSNQVNVTVTSGVVYVPITLSSNASILTDLDYLNLTAVTGPNGNGLTAYFYNGTTNIGQAIIGNVSGVYKAELIFHPAVGTNVYTAGP